MIIFFKTRTQARQHCIKTGLKAPTTKQDKGWPVNLKRKSK